MLMVVCSKLLEMYLSSVVETQAAGDMKKILGWQVFNIDGNRRCTRAVWQRPRLLAI